MRAVVGAALMLAACSPDTPSQQSAKPVRDGDLESAAIARGIISDPDNVQLAGLYARDSDRLCIVPDGLGYRIGVFVDYGDPIVCSGTGKVNRADETLHIELGRDGGCSFDASFENGRIEFPGRVPDGCERLCSSRASLAGLTVSRLSRSLSEAHALRDSHDRSLCPADE